GPRLAIGLEAILSRDDRERATESAFHLARDRRNALALQAACVPSSAWRKRDLRNGPSHGGNTSGSRADETFSTTSTGPLAVGSTAPGGSKPRPCRPVGVWRKPQVIAMPARSTPALVWVGCMPVSP